MENRSIIQPFRTWTSFLIANFIVGVLFHVFSDFHFNFINATITVIWSMFISITLWLGNAYLQGLINRKYTWLDYPIHRFFWTIVSVVIYSVLAYSVVQVIMYWFVVGYSPMKTLKDISGQWTMIMMISFGVSFVTGAIGFLNGWKESEIKQEQLKTEMMSYKYEALKNQINPHFLFNSLNVLTDLVYENQELAVKFIHKFSDIYRYVLESRDKELQPLNEEKEFIEKFVFLLQIRFEEKLKVTIDLPNNPEDLIVPLAIQLLVENAVKHNEISKQFPLEINIYREEDFVVVTNSIQSKKTNEESSKIGLKNLEQQYHFFTKTPMIVSSDEKQFTVKIPIVKSA